MKSSNHTCCKANCVIYTILITAIVLTCLGAGLRPLFENIYKNELLKRLVMKPGAESYNDWVDPPNAIYMKFYVFNYTNVDGFLKGEIPNVKQLGPYVYREHRLNNIISSNANEITYTQKYSYVFDPEQSCNSCKESDSVNTPNIALWTVFQLFTKANVSTAQQQQFVGTFGNVLMAKDFRPFHVLPVKILIWGYNDSFVEFVLKNKQTIIEELKIVDLKLPDLDPFISLQHNDTYEVDFIGNVSIRTGNENINDVQQIFAWRGLRTSPHWNNTYGNMINGTDGTHFKPYLDKYNDPDLYVFITDICRSITISYENEQDLLDVKLLRYRQTAKVFANASVNPDNIAFCVGKCWNSGIVPIGQCIKGGPPIFISQPHFFQADPWLISNVKGMHPNKAQHDTIVDIEPTTGIMMRVHKQIQLNLLASKAPFLPQTKNLKQNHTFLPLIYLDETLSLDEENTDKFKHEVYQPKLIMKWGLYALFMLSGILLLIAIIIFFKTKRSRSGYQAI